MTNLQINQNIYNHSMFQVFYKTPAKTTTYRLYYGLISTSF